MDGRAIQQALVNLIDNAIKHSPKGETVTVGLEAKDDKKAATFNSQLSTLHLFVADHGPGSRRRSTKRFLSGFTGVVPNCAAKPKGWALG